MNFEYIKRFEEPTKSARELIDLLPKTIGSRVRKRWLEMANQAPAVNGLGITIPTNWRTSDADLYVVEVVKPFRKKWTMPLDSSAADEEVCAEAKRLAEENRQFWNEVMAKVQYLKQLLRGQDELETALHVDGLMMAKLRQMAEKSAARGVPVDDLLADKQVRVKAIAARLCDEQFCRRRLRRVFGRVREEILRNHFLEVSNRRGLYVSHEALMARKNQRARNAAVLEAVLMINELGQEFKLAELMEKSNANPAIRRAELMVRIAGFEQIAKDLGHVGEFITLTCPSAYHAVHYKSGVKNDKFNDTTPREAAQYLNRVWARIRAQLAKEEIKIYGFRVAEPHHDGTPHWHGLFFMPKDKVQRFRQVVAMHGCRQDAKELGLKYFKTAAARRAQAKRIQDKQKAWMLPRGMKPQTLAEIEKDLALEAEFWGNADFWRLRKAAPRVEFVHINWKRGSAAGYIAKYIAKNIDGKNVHDESIGADYEALELDSAAVTAERVDAWAAVWGIRQFQQIGGPSVTVWRELRRLEISDDEDEGELMRAAEAADKGDWAKFVMVMGGVDCPRDVRPVALYKEDFGEMNRYGEPCAPVVRGVVERSTGVFKIGHVHDWVVKKCGEAAAWTCVNNCNNSKFSETKPLSDKALNGFEGAYDFEAAEIREWLRQKGENPHVDIEPYRVIFRQQRHIDAAEADAIRLPENVVADILESARIGAQVLRRKSDNLRTMRDYMAVIAKLMPKKRGIAPKREKLDLSDCKVSKKPSRVWNEPVAVTPEALIKRSKDLRMKMRAAMEQDAAKLADAMQ
ncbi:replication endonuclease [Neisseria wadsworthii]|uniref:replication endonuclease n=1 Tax=Neisseria wadsworthii TaxID=607711 RepID=UPI0015F60649|nr:replication endonuclease [Neisseria wadsworthii]QMT34815.1 replication endonuclease [Neisseria wadsworthii]